jgi:hypothetical protein
MTCGARLTTNYMRIGGVAFEIPEEFLPALDGLVNGDLPYRFEEYDQLLTGNEIIMMRARDVGVVTPEVAINASLSGPMLRSAGIAWDLRKADPYCVYDRMTFDIPVGYTAILRPWSSASKASLRSSARRDDLRWPAQGHCRWRCAARRRGVFARRVAEG